jgi:prepilin-type N-terminal cleavage/methylation domain-containing protein
MRSTPPPLTDADGFTLVELLLTMTILVMIAGVAYSSFTRALTIYQVDTKALALTQRLRVGLSSVTRDLTNSIVSANDPNLRLYFEDVPGELPNEGLDMISFVAVVEPIVEDDIGEPTSTQAPSMQGQTIQGAAQAEDLLVVPTDLLRIAYVIGPDPNQTASVSALDSTATQVLLRVTTSTLDVEEGFGDALVLGGESMLEALSDLGATIEVAAQDTRSLNFAFFDGEDWYSQWETEEAGVPRAVRAALTLQEPGGGSTTYTRSSAATPRTTPAPQPGPQQQQAGPQSGPQPQG